MLDLLRRAVKSWVAQVLLGLLVVSFAVWGIGDVGSGFSTRVATVGDQKVEADTFARVLRREQQRYGLDATQVRAAGLDRFVLGQMVREAAVEDMMQALGVSAPDEAVARQVRTTQSFQVAGTFDAAQYASAVRGAFRSVAAYEATVRAALASAQLQQAASVGAVAPQGVAQAMLAFREERRAFDAITLRDAGPAPEPTEADLKAHLDQNADAFATPETRAVTWLHIDPAAVADPVSDADLRAFYEERRASFEQPETRAVDQIVFADQASAQAAKARLDAGETDFDGLLAERGLTRADAGLGRIVRADLPDARASAAFASPSPEIVGPVETATGFALMDVRDIRPGVTVPFDAVRDEMARALAAEQGGPAADRLAERAEDLRAGGASLEEVAADLSLPIAIVAALIAQGAGPEGLAATAAFRAEAFAAAEGAERDAIRLPDGGYLILRVDAITPSRAPSLDEAREAVAQSWTAAARRAALAEAAEAARAQVAGGAPLAQVAAALGLEVEPLGPLRRDDPDARLGPDARAALFDARPGAVAITVGRDSATVAVLREVFAPPTMAETIAQIEAQFAESVARDQLEYLGRALEDRAGVTVNPAVFEAALAQIGA